MIYLEPPEDFQPKFHVGSCIIDANGELLLLQRQPHKPQGNTWCLPAGKVDEDDIVEGTLREVFEETGLRIDRSVLKSHGMVYVRYPGYDYYYHMHRTRLEVRSDIILNPEEHRDSIWKAPAAAKQLDLIPDLDWCIDYVYGVVHG